MRKLHAEDAVLDGVLERVTFANPETGYTIARIAPERGAELVTAVGPLLGAQIGEFLRLRGRWSAHPRYGRQFEVHSYATVLPATAAGIQKYLGSGLIKGIGPVMAERMVAHFGVDIMHVIEETPGRLIEVGGLGPKRTAMIAAAWAEQKAIKEVMIFLQGVGVSTSLAVRIYKKYGDASVSVVRHEPYRLAADVWGIGFKTADTIAVAVGIAADSPERIKAGLAYTLSEAADDGHCYLPAPNLIADAAKILDVPPELITPGLDELAAAEGVVREAVPAQAQAAPQVPAVYLPPFYQAERSVAHALLRLLAARADRLPAFGAVDWDKALGWLRGRTGAELAPEQADAVKLALTSKVAVLTGGPGCGKSFTVRSVVELARAKGARIVLAAPTGRAAKRLAELTGHEAATIHRLLQLRPGGEPSFDATNPLDADLVVVDETSMVDVILANKLLKAVAPGAHLLLVGDVDQLPSVGAGEVLRDLLAAGSLPVVRLTKIFRQAQQSGIVVNAHRINAGQPPALDGFGDFFWFGCEDTEQTAGLVTDIVARRIPARFGLDPRRDVQVLCPMHRGPAGAGNLNLLLQEALTPYAEGRARAALRRAGVPGRRQGHPAAEQLRQGRRRRLQRHRGRGHRDVPGGAHPDRPHRRGRIGGLRVRRAGRAGPRLRGHHPPLPGQRIPRGGHPAHHQLVDDAAAQPALHRGHPGQETGRAGRLPPCPGRRRPDQGRRPPPHRPRPPPARRLSPHRLNRGKTESARRIATRGLPTL